MCILNWALEFTAAGVTHARLSIPVAVGAEDERGYLLGIWYRSFAASVGYVAGLPIVAWVVLQNKEAADHLAIGLDCIPRVLRSSVSLTYTWPISGTAVPQ